MNMISTPRATLTFDFIIIGAGSARCVLANRLSADARFNVLLIEAGPPDRSPWIHLPLGLQIALRDARIEWRLATEPEPALKGRRIPCPRGRVLGGTSAMNGMIYIRGQAQDYDGWASAGCTGWGWADVLPLFMKSEDNHDLPAGPLHAHGGPLAVSTPPRNSVLCNALIEAGQGLGLPLTFDFNGANQEGVGHYQHTLAGGRRVSSAQAYLRPARGRANLTLWADTPAQRLLFDGRRACGVQVLHLGQLVNVAAAREVIVCAGAIHSPQLLQCSGIGAAAHLQTLGIAPVVSAPEVGLNLQDHVQARLRYTLNQPISLNDLYHRKLQLAWQTLQYAVARCGRMAQPPIRAGLFCRSSESEPRPDLQFHFIEFSSNAMGQPPHRHSGMQAAVCVLRPKSRGSVLASSPNMAQAPRIQGNYLTDEDDALRTLQGVKLARRLAQQPAFARFITEEAEPGPVAQSDEALLDWMRGNAVTVYHPVGTCRMGSDARAVLDPALRVRGVQGLRVADASVMPTLTSGNTNAPAIMIGEKCAQMVLADHVAA